MLIDTVAWLCIRDRRLLCVRTRGKDAFYLPGGKREPGESDWATLTREVAEEVQVTLERQNAARFGTYRGPAHGHGANAQVQIICYTASYQGTLSPGREIETMVWFTSRDRDRCAPVNQHVLDQLHQKQLID